MRYHRFDLNLLPALKVLLAEKNVTRAAEQMAITQPAMSGILARLREFFDDPLIIQVSRRMELTPFAKSLSERVDHVLLLVDATIDTKAEFDPVSARRHFVIATTDYSVSVVLMPVLQRLYDQAPGITFEFRQPMIGTSLPGQLEAGDIDFCFVPNWLPRPGFSSCALYEDVYCALVDRDNTKYGDVLSREEYDAARHVFFGKHGPTFVRQWVTTHHDAGQLDVELPVATLLPRMVVGTDRIATVLSRVAIEAERYWPVRRVRLGFETMTYSDVLIWHQFRDHDPAMIWFREQVVEYAQTLTL